MDESFDTQLTSQSLRVGLQECLGDSLTLEQATNSSHLGDIPVVYASRPEIPTTPRPAMDLKNVEASTAIDLYSSDIRVDIIYTPEILAEICSLSYQKTLANLGSSTDVHPSGIFYASSPQTSCASSFFDDFSESETTIELTDLGEAMYVSRQRLAVLLGQNSEDILEYLSKRPVSATGCVPSTPPNSKEAGASKFSFGTAFKHNRKKITPLKRPRSLNSESPTTRKRPKKPASKSLDSQSPPHLNMQDFRLDENEVPIPSSSRLMRNSCDISFPFRLSHVGKFEHQGLESEGGSVVRSSCESNSSWLTN